MFDTLIDAIDSFVWGWVLIVLVLGTGILLSVGKQNHHAENA